MFIVINNKHLIMFYIKWYYIVMPFSIPLGDKANTKQHSESKLQKFQHQRDKACLGLSNVRKFSNEISIICKIFLAIISI